MAATVTIGEAPLAADDVVAVARGARVELDGSARARIRAGCEVLAEVVAAGTAVYGVTTEVGHGKDVHLDDEALRRQQELLVMTHAGGIGPPLPTELVRAAMAVRLAGIARGGSGASEAAADSLQAMLNAGVHPRVPGIASVGAGDLQELAGVAQVAIGRGRAELGGETLPGGEALRRAGIQPLVLEGKDGLALMSANGVSIGHAALLVARAERTVGAADRVAMLSLEAVRGNPSVVLPAVGAAKAYPGQVEACRSMRAALEGSYLLEPGAPRSVQDALSFRVAPQVHGALREQLAYLRRAVDVELAGMGDNPLVSIADRSVVHNGNFHPLVLALACDALRVAIAQTGQLSDRRMSHLWRAYFERLGRMADLPPADALPPLPGVASRYPAARLVAELRQLAEPATLDAPPLDLGVEDHATSAPLSVRRTENALALLEDVLAVELLLARDVLAAYDPPPLLGAGTAAALRVADEAAAAADGPWPDAAHGALRARFGEL